MKIITLLLIFSVQLSFSQKDFKKPTCSNKYKKSYYLQKSKPLNPYLAIGVAGVSDLVSHQIGNSFRFTVVSNKWFQVVNEVSNYSRINYMDKNRSISEREMGVSINCGLSNQKPFYLYAIMGVAHRKVTATETSPRSNNCNSFSFGGGLQMNFKYLSPFIESRLIKQDYANPFIGLFQSGRWHPVISAGVNLHVAQEIERKGKVFKQHVNW